MPEWLKGADCKSAGFGLRRFEPSSPHHPLRNPILPTKGVPEMSPSIATIDTDQLKEGARKARINVIKMVHEAGSGHPGGSLSACDIMTVLMFRFLKHDPKNPRWEDRDRFVLSKGHCIPAWYALQAEADYFPEEDLLSLRKLESPLQGHPHNTKYEGVEA